MKVYIKNLKRRTDKRWACFGAMLSHGWKEDDLIFWCAHDAKQYASEKEQQAAFETRWKFYPYPQEYWELHCQKGYLGNLWTTLEILGEVVDQGEPAILMNDDYYIQNEDCWEHRLYILQTRLTGKIDRIVSLTGERENDNAIAFSVDGAKAMLNAMLYETPGITRYESFGYNCLSYHYYDKTYKFAYPIGPEGTFKSDIRS